MSFSIPRGPQRIVCLTEEPTEILYALGEQHRIVGITAYTERPAHAKQAHPVVSSFVGGSLQRIQALKPDLVIGFSDVQAEYARNLIHAGLPVLIFNQRSIEEILNVIVSLSQLVGAQPKGRELVEGYVRRLNEAKARSDRRKHRPRVYFEEWDDPMISAIRWVSELIEIAGGEPLFREQALSAASKGRQVTVAEVRAGAPDVILASWCGKAFDELALRERLGVGIPAFASGRVHALPPEVILQPGPACLTDGLDLLERLIAPQSGDLG